MTLNAPAFSSPHTTAADTTTEESATGSSTQSPSYSRSVIDTALGGDASSTSSTNSTASTPFTNSVHLLAYAQWKQGPGSTLGQRQAAASLEPDVDGATSAAVVSASPVLPNASSAPAVIPDPQTDPPTPKRELSLVAQSFAMPPQGGAPVTPIPAHHLGLGSQSRPIDLSPTVVHPELEPISGSFTSPSDSRALQPDQDAGTKQNVIAKDVLQTVSNGLAPVVAAAPSTAASLPAIQNVKRTVSS